VTDGDQLRLEADLLEVMRSAVTAALESGSASVAPAHLLLGLLADARIGPAIAPLISRAEVLRAAEDASQRLPELAETPEDALPDGERVPFARRDTVAFLSRDGAHSLYLDAGAFHVFLEGARRATGAYRAKHLVFALTAEAVKERELLELVGRDPQAMTKAVDALG
jgi:hypothetical protein